MKHLFMTVVCLLLSFSVVRSLVGQTPLTLESFLYSLEQLDIDFSTTLKYWYNIVSEFQSIGSGNIFQAVASVLKGVYLLLNIPVAIIVDLFEFLTSVIKFCSFLLGFDIL